MVKTLYCLDFQTHELVTECGIKQVFHSHKALKLKMRLHQKYWEKCKIGKGLTTYTEKITVEHL